MAKQKNPAVSEYLAEIGRKGGQVKGRKGFSAMDETTRKEISRKGVEARQKKAKMKKGSKRK